MNLTVYFGEERVEIERPVTDIALYLHSRIRGDRARDYRAQALDGAAIRLSLDYSVLPSGPGYLVHRDGRIVRAYRSWLRAVNLFMVLVELVPRDQKEIT